MLAIAVLAWVAVRSVVRMIAKGDQLVALRNGQSLMLAMNDFHAEFGSFPDRKTAQHLAAMIDTQLDLSGDSANDYFRQLIAAGICKSEDPFFSVTPYSPYPPDNVTTGKYALSAREVGFGYIMNGDAAIGIDNPDRIIAVTPLLNASASDDFDPAPLAGKAVVVCLDTTTKALPIREDHKIVVSGTHTTLLDYGAHTSWGIAIKPVLKPPKTQNRNP